MGLRECQMIAAEQRHQCGGGVEHDAGTAGPGADRER
jgi:hypothetical protein